LPAVFVLGACTVVLVIGIRESAMSNATMVLVKLGVVVFVIVIGIPLVTPAYWTSIPPEARKLPEEILLPGLANDHARAEGNLLASAQQWIREFDPPKVDPEKASHVKKAIVDADTGRRTLEGRAADQTLAESDLIEKRGETLGRQAVAVFRIRHAEQTGNAALLQSVRERHATFPAIRATSRLSRRSSARRATRPASSARPTATGVSWPRSAFTIAWPPGTTRRAVPLFPTASPASSSAPPSSSSPSSALTRSRRTPRRLAIRSATCRSASSRR
jgi:hypothetical protein